MTYEQFAYWLHGYIASQHLNESNTQFQQILDALSQVTKVSIYQGGSLGGSIANVPYNPVPMPFWNGIPTATNSGNSNY